MRAGERITLRAVLGERGAPAAHPRPPGGRAARLLPGDRAAGLRAARVGARDRCLLRRPSRPRVRGRRRPALFVHGRRAPPRRRPPAHLRRRERRALLRPRRSLASSSRPRTTPGGCDQQYVMDLATGATRARLHRARPHDLRLLRLAGGRPRRVRVDPRERRRVPGAARPLAGLRVGGLRHVRPLRGAARRRRGAPAHRDAGLRRRGHVVPSRRDARLHLRARRRPRSLRDGRGGGDAAPHRHAGLRRRRVLQPRLLGDRVAGQPPDGGGARRLPRAARAAASSARTRWRSSS